MPTITFRFYAELNDFLAPDQCQAAFQHTFGGDASVKDRIESLGVPHTEVAAVFVDGDSVGFGYLVQDGDRIAVYPSFRRLALAQPDRLRPDYHGKPRFVADIHLGKLVNYLRMLGFDTLYRNDYADRELAQIARVEDRILLTRDLGLLKRREVIYGYYVRSLKPRVQIREVMHRFDLFSAMEPFHRCLACNGLLHSVSKQEVLDRLEPKTERYYDHFYRCRSCNQIYWKGSHFQKMQRFIHAISSAR